MTRRWLFADQLGPHRNVCAGRAGRHVHTVEDAFRAGKAPLASAEGFIRQIIGWRDFVWHLYWYFDPGYRRANELRATGKLPKWFAELDADAVDAACLSDVLRGIRDRGWVHHIPRLMVLGNYAMQRGWRPGAMSDWFHRAFVDGYEWAMTANVIGMSQFADTGRMRRPGAAARLRASGSSRARTWARTPGRSASGSRT